MATTKKAASPDPYFDLVRAFPLRRLKTAADHSKASSIYLRLAADKPSSGTRDYLDVLVDLIADYEKRAELTVDTSGVSAADLIRHRLDEEGLSVSALARDIGIAQSNLSQMLAGSRDWSKAAIRALSSRFHIRAERFLL